jgi:hypothetical protein
VAGLDRFHLLILDDLAYFTKDQAETSVLFELIASYERRSMLVTANQPFGEWGKVAMTLAAHEPRETEPDPRPGRKAASPDLRRILPAYRRGRLISP